MSHAADAQARATTAAAIADRVGPSCFRLGVTAFWTYSCAIFPFSRVFKSGGIGVAVFIAGCAFILSASGMRIVQRWVSSARMLELGFSTLILTLMIFAGDLAFAVRDNWIRSRSLQRVASDLRARDRRVWHGELYPRTYVPEGESFSLYKPNVRLMGETYGERYVATMLGSRTLVNSVLERRRLSYFIGPEGLRELEPLSRSRTFALGDSFTFGFATDEGKIWPDLLGSSLGEPIYNLGVSATGPRPQLQLLKYMLKTYPDSMQIRRLIWMIFEGNDLENSYGEDSLAASTLTGPAALLEGTPIEAFLSLPARVRNGSVVGRLARGELTLSAGVTRYGQYHIDGVDLPIPLFHSKRFGYRLFVPADIEAAIKPREYLLNHPNRPLLDQTFREMRDLGHQQSFAVTVVIAPSDARLYGRSFDGFPALSPEPHFIDYVTSLGGQMGFSVVNLLPLLEPFAKDELLYYRDDHHWNERGNAVVAQLLATALARQ